jgi:circadian clock protein KaiC
MVAEIQKHSPSLVLVDSFRSVILASETDGHKSISLQEFIQQRGMLMTSWQATTFLLGECSSDDDPSPVFSVADGLIWLLQSTHGNSIVRTIEVMKVCG